MVTQFFFLCYISYFGKTDTASFSFFYNCCSYIYGMSLLLFDLNNIDWRYRRKKLIGYYLSILQWLRISEGKKLLGDRDRMVTYQKQSFADVLQNRCWPGPATLLKWESNTAVFPRNVRNFWEHLLLQDTSGGSFWLKFFWFSQMIGTLEKIVMTQTWLICQEGQILRNKNSIDVFEFSNFHFPIRIIHSFLRSRLISSMLKIKLWYV